MRSRKILFFLLVFLAAAESRGEMPRAQANEEKNYAPENAFNRWRRIRNKFVISPTGEKLYLTPGGEYLPDTVIPSREDQKGLQAMLKERHRRNNRGILRLLEAFIEKYQSNARELAPPIDKVELRVDLNLVHDLIRTLGDGLSVLDCISSENAFAPRDASH